MPTNIVTLEQTRAYFSSLIYKLLVEKDLQGAPKLSLESTLLGAPLVSLSYFITSRILVSY